MCISSKCNKNKKRSKTDFFSHFALLSFVLVIFFNVKDTDSQLSCTNSGHLSVFVIYVLNHAQIIVIIVYKFIM